MRERIRQATGDSRARPPRLIEAEARRRAQGEASTAEFSSAPSTAPARGRVMHRAIRLGAAALAFLTLAPGAHAAPRSRSYWVCVAHERSGDLTIVDGTTRRVVATIPLGKRARGVHASPDGRTLFVALRGTPIAGADESHSSTTVAAFPNGRAEAGPDGIAVVDLAKRRVTRMLPGGSDPTEFAVTADGQRLFVADAGAGTVDAVRVRDGRVEHRVRVENGPEGVSVSPDGRSVYVACGAAGAVSVIDGRTGEAVGRIDVGGRPRAVAFLPDGSCAFVPSETEGKLRVIDTASRKVTKTLTLPAGSRPAGVAMRPDGKVLYVTTGAGDAVAVVDPVTETLQGKIEAGEEAGGAALSPDGRTLYVANGSSNDVSVIDTRTRKETARIRVGQGPWGVAVVAAPEARRKR